MGQYLSDHKFDTLVNPAGTLFHPSAIHTWLRQSTDFLDDKWLVSSDGIYKHYFAHSRISSIDAKTLRERLQIAKQQLDAQVARSRWLLLTYGTAWGYWLTRESQWVANCHKQPDRLFERRLSTTQDLVEDASQTFEELWERNAHLQILLTVSPVRHLREGLVDNNLSKAHLLSATHELVAKYRQVHYFPAFEIQMDELRDYRFYGQDRIHPSQEAVDYIWIRFQECCIDAPTRKFIKEWAAIWQALHHRPFHPESEVHQVFLKDTLAKLRQLPASVDVSKEEVLLTQQLNPHL